jgi:hypothetical protein
LATSTQATILAVGGGKYQLTLGSGVVVMVAAVIGPVFGIRLMGILWKKRRNKATGMGLVFSWRGLSYRYGPGF